MEQVEPRAHLHRIRTSIGARDAAEKAVRSLSGKARGTLMPTTFERKRSIDSFHALTSSQSTSQIRSESLRRHPTSTRFCVVIRNWLARSRLPGFLNRCEFRERMLSRLLPSTCWQHARPGEIYRYIVGVKGEDNLIAEVSMDETDLPQTPPELLIIWRRWRMRRFVCRRSLRSSPGDSIRASTTSETSASLSESSTTILR